MYLNTNNSLVATAPSTSETITPVELIVAATATILVLVVVT